MRNQAEHNSCLHFQQPIPQPHYQTLPASQYYGRTANDQKLEAGRPENKTYSKWQGRGKNGGQCINIAVNYNTGMECTHFLPPSNHSLLTCLEYLMLKKGVVGGMICICWLSFEALIIRCLLGICYVIEKQQQLNSVLKENMQQACIRQSRTMILKDRLSITNSKIAVCARKRPVDLHHHFVFQQLTPQYNRVISSVVGITS